MGEINQLLVDIFDAGTDTTSSTFDWVTSELIRNSKMMAKAQEEIEQVLGKDRQIQESDIIKLPYLQAIIKETLRLHPLQYFSYLVKPTLMLSYMTMLCQEVHKYLLTCGQLEEILRRGENPDVFSPKRFLGSEIDVKGRDFRLLPFGARRRICPGMNLAIRILTEFSNFTIIFQLEA
ncbi:Cytochrome P450 76AD1 [Bienertia sinuspersici]